MGSGSSEKRLSEGVNEPFREEVIDDGFFNVNVWLLPQIESCWGELLPALGVDHNQHGRAHDEVLIYGDNLGYLIGAKLHEASKRVDGKAC